MERRTEGIADESEPAVPGGADAELKAGEDVLKGG